MRKDLVFVWDMDQTLIGNYFEIDLMPIPELDFNENAMAVLRKARTSPNVAALVLFTNNSDPAFIHHVLRNIDVKFDVKFDVVIDGTRPDETHELPKHLNIIQEALIRAGIDATNLANRVYFFDDIRDHELRYELADPSQQYIVIDPPYSKENLVDATNFRPAVAALAVSQGGKRRKYTYKPRNKSKRSKKQYRFLYKTAYH